MRTAALHSYQFDRETYDEQREAGRYNPARVIIWRGHRYAIGAGDGDDLDLFTEGRALYVLARRRSLGYAGLEVFRDGERIADIFVQDDETGDYLNELTAVYAAKRLANWADAEGGEACGYDF
jgi:hypothetical protein